MRPQAGDVNGVGQASVSWQHDVPRLRFNHPIVGWEH
jgi:hypothetical protein